MPKTWLPMPTVAASRLMPGCVSKRPTALGWSACCAIARSPVPEDANADAGSTVTAVALGRSGVAVQPEPQAKLKPRPPAHYLWAALIARIYEVFPLICPMCGGQMRLIALAAT